jgi:glycosyltransferase involved in cell wall biosynthesis
MAKTVNILLSSYNGMRFLEQQIDSLLAQSYPHIVITVRDDGSTDGTYEKLLEYTRQYSNFVVLRGENMGVIGSYFKLLREAAPDYDFYAFCDQDDVWLPHKIRDAVAAMGSYDFSRPVMYFSKLEYVDFQLRHLGYSKVFRRFGFANALVKNVVTGCTIVLNQEARKLICEQTPSRVSMHDWWCYLVVSALGQLIYDECPNIKYRLHGNNVVGHTINCWKRLRRRLAYYRNPKKDVFRASDQAKEFYRCYAKHLSPRELRILEDFLEAKNGIWSGFKYAMRMKVWSHSRLETAALRLRIIIGRF